MKNIKLLILILFLSKFSVSSPHQDGTNNDNKIKLSSEFNENTSDGYRFSYVLFKNLLQ